MRFGWQHAFLFYIIGTPNSCVFPFKYEGNEYYTCTKAGDTEYWCGTSYEYSTGSYEYCSGKFYILLSF